MSPDGPSAAGRRRAETKPTLVARRPKPPTRTLNNDMLAAKRKAAPASGTPPAKRQQAHGAPLARTVSLLDLRPPAAGVESDHELDAVPPARPGSTHPTEVFEPAPGLPGDATFGSADGRTEFLLHRWMLQLRSPVLAALLQADRSPTLSPPFVARLPERSADLKLFFQALYSNAPQSLVTVHNVVALTRLAHKYEASDLEQVCWGHVNSKLVKCAKWTGTTPSLPELLLLGQQCANESILTAVLAAPNALRAFAPSPPMTCALHPYEALPCHYATPGCGASELALARSTGATPSESTEQLRQLSPATLVALIGALAAFRR
jgi:hypothetical protein